MVRIQLRRDTATNWSTANPVLSSGEAGYDTTNKLLKIGDGATAWNNLASLPAPSEITALDNELNQLASTVTGLETSKQDTLTAGDNITIVDNVISATASGGSSNYEDLTNKPQINSVELNGNVSLASLDVYDKDEVDGQLLLKENKITAVSPISLSYYVKSNLEGFTYTTGGNGIYSTDGVGYYLGTGSASASSANIGIGVGTDSFEGATGFNPKSYIDVPYTIGQTLLTPPGISFSGNRSLPVVFGKVLQNGDFIPICFMGAVISSSYLTITTSDTPQIATANNLRFPYVGITGSQPNWGNRTNAPSLFGLARIFKSSDTTYYVDYDARRAQAGYLYDLYSVRFTITDSTQIARLKEITTARIFSNAYSASSLDYGVNADSPIYINTIGLYNDVPLNGNIDFNTLTNLFEIDKETAYNYLELNLSAEEGNTLEVKSDGLYASAPVSDGYTKAEVDTKLNDKQNTLTAHSPLTISKYAYSNLEGWNYTSDGTGIYNTTMRYSLRPSRVSSSSNSILIPYGANSIQCKVVIPYQIGQVIKIPSKTFTYDNLNYQIENIALCKMLSDGTLIPIINPVSAVITNNINQIDTPTSESTGSVVFQAGGSGTDSAISSPNWQGTDTNICYIQLWSQDSDTVYIQGTNGLQAGVNYSYTGADAARLREVNCAVITPYYYDGGTYEQHYGDNTDNALPVADFGLYNANQALLLYSGPSSFTENLFSIEGSSLTTNLELKISSEENNALELKDDGLYASGGIPDYTKGINIAFTSNGLSYTAPANGVVSIQAVAVGSTLASILVNGAVVLKLDSGQSSVLGHMTAQIIVGKGDVITSDNIYQPTSTDVNSATFYPMKGAN